MLAKPDDCRGCPLEHLGRGFGTTDGTGRNGVLIVLEALGKYEADTGIPLSGKSGDVFDTMLRRGNLVRQDFKIFNSVNCQPPNNTLRGASYEHDALAHCAPYLDRVIADMRPRCLVAAGAVALRRLLPDCPVGISDARGYPCWSETYATWVVPTFHPAHILRGQTALTLVFIHDLLRAVEIAKEGFENLQFVDEMGHVITEDDRSSDSLIDDDIPF